MTELTDLEINLAIARIECIVIEHITNTDNAIMIYSEDVEQEYKLYNPLTDDYLIFPLAFKNKVKIDYFDECVYITSPRKVTRHRFDKDDIESLRKAILLAIIEAHKEL